MRVNYGGPLVVPMTYTAQVEVVGTYTEPPGYGYTPEHTAVRRVVWQGDTEHESEERALIEAVEKLAEMIGRLA